MKLAPHHPRGGRFRTLDRTPIGPNLATLLLRLLWATALSAYLVGIAQFDLPEVLRNLGIHPQAPAMTLTGFFPALFGPALIHVRIIETGVTRDTLRTILWLGGGPVLGMGSALVGLVAYAQGWPTVVRAMESLALLPLFITLGAVSRRGHLPWLAEALANGRAGTHEVLDGFIDQPLPYRTARHVVGLLASRAVLRGELDAAKRWLRALRRVWADDRLDTPLAPVAVLIDLVDGTAGAPAAALMDAWTPDPREERSVFDAEAPVLRAWLDGTDIDGDGPFAAWARSHALTDNDAIALLADHVDGSSLAHEACRIRHQALAGSEVTTPTE